MACPQIQHAGRVRSDMSAVTKPVEALPHTPNIETDSLTVVEHVAGFEIHDPCDIINRNVDDR